MSRLSPNPYQVHQRVILVGVIVPDPIEIVLYAVGVVALVSIVIGAMAFIRAAIADRAASRIARRGLP